MTNGPLSQTEIKSKRKLLVKWACVTSLLFVIAFVAVAEENIPDINAKAYNTQIDRRSASGRVYLVKVSTPGTDLPQQGRVVLLRQNGVPVMAFRVLKDYPDQNQFAGKWIRRYGDTKDLEPSTQYQAIEKISDKEVAAPALTKQDQKDVKELEAPQTAAPPPAAEATAPPPPPPEMTAPLPSETPMAQASPEVTPSPLSLLGPSPSPVPPSALPSEPPTPVPPPVEMAPSPLPSEALAPLPPPETSPTPEPTLAQPEPSPLASETPLPPPTDATAQASPAPDSSLPPPQAAVDNSESIPAPGGPSPQPTAEVASNPEPVPYVSPQPADDDLSSVMIEETKPFDRDNNALSVGAGLYRNNLASTSTNSSNQVTTSTVSIYNSAGMIRYSRTLKHNLRFKSKNWQDNLAIDGSIGFYKYLGISSSGDTYTVVPIGANLRYTILPNEDFGFFGYVGFLKNTVAQSVNPSATVLTGLNTLFPEIGVGMLFRIGPSWYIRGDAGLDFIGLSIALRF